ncbi:MAG: hypothetical protein HY225_01810 [Candidatus Vogelbacteria bacterium]|nr:hypothetical protein [Candidatus Vogelbacteria bacterium]
MTEVKKLEKSQVEIAGEISAEEFNSYWKRAVENLSNSVKIDGFRTGHIPEDILIKNIGESAILDTAAELALKHNYPKIILENKIEAIGRPAISITKIAKNNPLGFKILTAVIPKLTLPDYKSIAKKVFEESRGKEIRVEDKEVEDLILELRRRRAHLETKHEHTANEAAPKDEDLTPFDDVFVKTLGDFKDVPDFKEKMKVNIKLEKEVAEKESARFKTMEAVNEKSEMELPEILVENELNKGISQMRAEVEREGLEFDEYLKGVKKTVDDIRKEARPKAEKSVRYNLILKNIAKSEALSVPDEEIDKEAKKLLEVYEGADLDSARIYVEDILLNNKVFQYLEELK